MQLQSAIFDMDGTLIDSMPMWMEVGLNVLHAHGIHPEPELANYLSTLTLEQAADYCREQYLPTLTADALLQEIYDQAETFFRNEVQAKPGVCAFLSLLQSKGVKMCVATNTDRYLVDIALRHAGLDSYFQEILTCSEVGQGKKAGSKIYEQALLRLSANKQDTVVFEDALHAIRTAKNAGFRVCAIYDPAAEQEQEEIRNLSDYYVRSFGELISKRNEEIST